MPQKNTIFGSKFSLLVLCYPITKSAINIDFPLTSISIFPIRTDWIFSTMFSISSFPFLEANSNKSPTILRLRWNPERPQLPKSAIEIFRQMQYYFPTYRWFSSVKQSINRLFLCVDCSKKYQRFFPQFGILPGRYYQKIFYFYLP